MLTQVTNTKSKQSGVILIVEDNYDTQRVISTQLTHFNYSPICKSSGQEALEWLEHNHADLVLLDIMLPDISGMDICRQIRMRHPANTLPILMLSALGQDSDDRVQGLQAGANDFMAKPYHLDELLARITVLLNVKNSTEEQEKLLSVYVARGIHAQARLDPAFLKRREHRETVVMFADLRGFTRLSTRVSAVALLQVLDDFFDSMMSTIGQHGGITLDITGDELLAIVDRDD